MYTHVTRGARLVALAILVSAPGPTAHAEDVYFRVPVERLDLDSPLPGIERSRTFAPPGRPEARAHVELDEGEGYLLLAEPVPGEDPGGPVEVVVHVERSHPVSGTLVVWSGDSGRFARRSFTLEAQGSDAGAEAAFYRAKATHYENLLWREIPGAAWFRHQADVARARAGDGAPDSVTGDRPRVGRPVTRRERRELADAYALVTGGRALAENLQLDRLLPETSPGEATIDVATIDGITVAEMNWDSLTTGLDPELDPLARAIPVDQHALFFPGVDALVTLLDELEMQAFPLFRATSPRGEALHTLARYEAQLAITLKNLARALGGIPVGSIALTGSDPYLVAGSDVALLFETTDPDALRAFLVARHDVVQARGQGAGRIAARAGGLAYTGVRTDDRRIASFVAVIEGGVVLTNSIAQLERLAAVQDGAPTLASSSEYVFFRDRYARGSEESFLVLTDATIRRWCGPAWRIGGARRTQALGAISDVQATLIETIAEAGEEETSIDAGLLPGWPAHREGETATLYAGPRGVRSATYGRLDFETPIVEILPSKVTEAEADAYAAWRSRYQQNWRRFFDPIAARITVNADHIDVDLSVMPLIEGSDYRGILGLTRGSTIAPDAGDRHLDALLHLAVALDVDAPGMRNAGGFASAFSPGSGPVFGWLGGSISLYVDDDPYWEEMAEAEDPKRFIGDTWHRLPLALNAEVDDPLALTLFLSGLRAFVEQTAPGLSVWEPLTYADQPYVRVSSAAPLGRGVPAGFALYYAVTPETFVLTPSESVLRRALDRQAARLAARARGDELPDYGEPWLGESLALRATSRLVDVLEAASVSWVRDAMRRRSWDNLPILNEWRRLFPDEDPVALHRRLWGVELICPGGGRYIWDETAETMSSTAYGHPAAPLDGPRASATIFSQLGSGSFGLTFGENELRARVTLVRAQAARAPTR